MSEIHDLYIKLAKARKSIQGVAKSKTAEVGAYTYSYATLADVMHAVDTACDKHGLQWLQHTSVEGDRWTLDTMILDIETGAAASFHGPPGTVKADPQAMGSAFTYYRRYALVTLFGMNVTDDDGGQAHRAAVSPNQRTPAEEETRQIIAGMSKEDRTMFIADFKGEFGTGLSDLPESRHGDALTYAKFWNDTPSETKKEV